VEQDSPPPKIVRPWETPVVADVIANVALNLRGASERWRERHG
jgi:hypothetical protein